MAVQKLSLEVELDLLLKRLGVDSSQIEKAIQASLQGLQVGTVPVSPNLVLDPKAAKDVRAQAQAQVSAGIAQAGAVRGGFAVPPPSASAAEQKAFAEITRAELAYRNAKGEAGDARIQAVQQLVTRQTAALQRSLEYSEFAALAQTVANTQAKKLEGLLPAAGGTPQRKAAEDLLDYYATGQVLGKKGAPLAQSTIQRRFAGAPKAYVSGQAVQKQLSADGFNKLVAEEVAARQPVFSDFKQILRTTATGGQQEIPKGLLDKIQALREGSVGAGAFTKEDVKTIQQVVEPRLQTSLQQQRTLLNAASRIRQPAGEDGTPGKPLDVTQVRTAVSELEGLRQLLGKTFRLDSAGAVARDLDRITQGASKTELALRAMQERFSATGKTRDAAAHLQAVRLQREAKDLNEAAEKARTSPNARAELAALDKQLTSVQKRSALLDQGLPVQTPLEKAQEQKRAAVQRTGQIRLTAAQELAKASASAEGIQTSLREPGRQGEAFAGIGQSVSGLQNRLVQLGGTLDSLGRKDGVDFEAAKRQTAEVLQNIRAIGAELRQQQGLYKVADAKGLDERRKTAEIDKAFKSRGRDDEKARVSRAAVFDQAEREAATSRKSDEGLGFGAIKSRQRNQDKLDKAVEAQARREVSSHEQRLDAAKAAHKQNLATQSKRVADDKKRNEAIDKAFKSRESADAKAEASRAAVFDRVEREAATSRKSDEGLGFGAIKSRQRHQDKLDKAVEAQARREVSLHGQQLDAAKAEHKQNLAAQAKRVADDKKRNEAIDRAFKSRESADAKAEASRAAIFDRAERGAATSRKSDEGLGFGAIKSRQRHQDKLSKAVEAQARREISSHEQRIDAAKAAHKQNLAAQAKRVADDKKRNEAIDRAFKSRESADAKAKASRAAVFDQAEREAATSRKSDEGLGFGAIKSRQRQQDKLDKAVEAQARREISSHEQRLDAAKAAHKQNLAAQAKRDKELEKARKEGVKRSNIEAVRKAESAPGRGFYSASVAQGGDYLGAIAQSPAQAAAVRQYLTNQKLGLQDQIKAVRTSPNKATDAALKQVEEYADKARALKKELAALTKAEQAAAAARKKAAAVASPLDAARLQYGAQVVTRAGGAASLAKHGADVVRDRADLPYAAEYLTQQRQSLRAQTDQALLDGNKGKAEALRNEALRYDDALKGVNKRMQGHVSALSQAGNLFRSFAKYALGYAAGYQILAGIRALITGVTELDAALVSIQAVTQSTDQQMRTIETSIKRVAVATKFTTQEIAAAAQVLGQAGVAAEDFPSVLTAVSRFAAATESELELSADLFSTMRNVFAELEDTGIANQLTRAVNISKLNAADLKTILSLSAQMGESYNLASEQYLAAVSTLRNAGIKASTVATGLRQSLIEVFSPDAKTLKVLSKRYQEIGELISPDQISSKFLGFSQERAPLVSVVNELRRLGYSGTGESTFQRTFDVRAENAIKALIRQFEELQQAEAKITFGEAALEGSAKQMESITNSMKNLGAAIGAAAHDLSRDMLPVIRDMTQGTTELVERFQLLNEEMRIISGGEGGYGSSIAAGGLAGILGSTLASPGTPLPARLIRGSVAALAGGTGAGYVKYQTAEGGGDAQDIANNQLYTALAAGLVASQAGNIIKAPKNIYDRIRERSVLRGATRNLPTGTGPAWGGKEVGKFSKAVGGATTGLAKLRSGFSGLASILGNLIRTFGKFHIAVAAFSALFATGLLGDFTDKIKEFLGFEVDKKKTDAEKALGRIDDISRSRERAAGEYVDAATEVAALRTTAPDGSYTAKTGSAPYQIEQRAKLIEDAHTAIRQQFGEVGETDRRLIEDELFAIGREFPDQMSQGFSDRVEELSRLLEGAGIELAASNKVIHELASEVNAARSFAKGLETEIVGETSRYETETRLEPGEAIRLKAGLAAEKATPDVAQRIEQGEVLSAADRGRFLDAYYQSLREQDEAIKNLDAEKAAVAIEKYTRSIIEMTKKILESQNLQGPALTAAKQELYKAIYAHGNGAIEVLLKQVKAAEVELARLEQRGARQLAAPQVVADPEWVARIEATETAARDRVSALQRIADDTIQAAENSVRQDTAARYSEATRAILDMATILQQPGVYESIQEGATAFDGGPTALYKSLSEFFDLTGTEPEALDFAEEEIRDLEQNVTVISVQLEELGRALEAFRKIAADEGRDQAVRDVAAERAEEILDDISTGREERDRALTEAAQIRQDSPLLVPYVDPTRVDDPLRRVGPTVTDTLNSLGLKGRAIATDRASEEKFLYIEGEEERQMRDRIYQLKMSTEELRDQRRFSEELGASEEMYALELELASRRLAFDRKVLKRYVDEPALVTDSKLQSQYEKVRKGEEGLRDLRYRSDKASYGVRVASVGDTQKGLEAQMADIKTITDHMLANPLFTDWDQFNTLSEQFDQVLRRLIEVIRQDGILYHKSQAEINQQIEAVKAKGEDLFTFTDAFDKATKVLKQYVDSFDTLYSPNFIGSEEYTNLPLALERQKLGISEPIDARLGVAVDKAEQLREALDVAVEQQERAIANLAKADAANRPNTKQSAAVVASQKLVQDLATQITETDAEIVALSLDIHEALVQGFNVEGIMSSLRAQVEDTIGGLAEFIRGAFDTLFDDLSNTLVDAAFGDLEGNLGESLDQVAKDFAKSLAKQILKSLLQKAVFSALEKVLPGSKEAATKQDPRLVGAFNAGKTLSVTAARVNMSASSVYVNGQPLGTELKGIAPAPIPGLEGLKGASYVKSGEYKGLELSYAQRLDNLRKDAAAQGYNTTVTSTYRDPDDPLIQKMYEDWKRDPNPKKYPMAAPSNSMHATRVTADIATDSMEGYRYLHKQAPEHELDFRLGMKDKVHVELAGAQPLQSALRDAAKSTDRLAVDFEASDNPRDLVSAAQTVEVQGSVVNVNAGVEGSTSTPSTPTLPSAPGVGTNTPAAEAAKKGVEEASKATSKVTGAVTKTMADAAATVEAKAPAVEAAGGDMTGSLINTLKGVAGTAEGMLQGLANVGGAGLKKVVGGLNLFKTIAGGFGFGFKAGSTPGERTRSGVLKGPGTGTSDSLPGALLDKSGKPAAGIAVSSGESILTEKATDSLGEPFIHWINNNAGKFAGGGIMTPYGAVPSQAQSMPLSTSKMSANKQPYLDLEALSKVAPSGSTPPSAMRLEVSDSALHRTLGDYLEDYFADVIANR